MSDSTAAIQINLTGDIEAAVRQLRADFKELTGKVGGFENEVNKAFKESARHTNALKDSIKQISFSSLVDNVRNVNDAFKGLSAPGLDFQQQIADLSAITGITGQDLDSLSKAAREVGKESGLGASQATEAFKLLASNIDIATIGGVEGLKALQKETITLSQAAGVDLPTAANTMSFALNQFQLPVSEAARMINVLGAGAKYGAAEIPDLSESLKQSGATAHQAGLSIEQATGAIEILSQRGLKGAEAGTALRNVILKLQTEMKMDLRKTGLSDALDSMKGKLSDTIYLEKIFGRENINAAQILISSAGAVDEMTKRVTGTNTAYEQAAIRTNTYQHEIELLRAKMNDFKLKIFESTGALVPWTEVLSEGAMGLSQMVPLFWGVGTAIKALRTSQLALNAAQYAMPVLAIIGGLTALGLTIYSLTSGMDDLNATIQEYNNAELEAKKRTIDEKFETERLFKVINDTTRGTYERTVALEQLKKKSQEYFGQLTLETATTKEGTIAMNQYADSIQNVAMAEAVKELIKEKQKKRLELETNGYDSDILSINWLKQNYNMVIGSMTGGGGVAAATAYNAMSRQDVINTGIEEYDKSIGYLITKLDKLEMPTDSETYKGNYSSFADRYDSGLVPFGPSPAPASAQGVNTPLGGKSTSIGKMESNITINTTNLAMSPAEIEKIVTKTIHKALKDTSQIN